MINVCTLCVLLAAGSADLTGNWVVRAAQPDGTTRRTYINLKQEGGRLTGSIRVTQFYYLIKESSGGADGFTLTASMRDGKNERQVVYQGKMVGDELRLATRRRPDAPPVEMVAVRAPPGEGALPARLLLPPLHRVPDNGLARTPPMGWNSWNKFASRVDESVIRETADAMVSSGMKDVGYVYINIDDTWEGERDATGNIQSNKKFPNMKSLADYVHARGLKLGIYSSPGPNTCAGYEGSYGYEDQDARTFAAWGIDYLKYDWCGARTLYSDEEMQALYQKMGDALRATGRPIVYSLCQYGRQEVWKWGPEVGGNLWRTTGDIRDSWEAMSKIGFGQDELGEWARPGHWNDPDMLEIGNGGMTEDEYKTHMSLWAILAAPLLAGNDLRQMTSSIRDILTNREVIAVDQDKDGKQGRRRWKSGDREVWVRPLAQDARAVAFFNRGTAEAQISAKWAELGIDEPPKRIRDLWARREVKVQGSQFSATVPPHGVVLLRISR